MNTQTEAILTNVESAVSQDIGSVGSGVTVYPAAKVCEYDGWVYRFTGEGKLRKEAVDGDSKEFYLPGKKPGEVHSTLCIDGGWLYCLEILNPGYRLFRHNTDGMDVENLCDFGVNFNPDKFLVCDGWVYYSDTDKGLFRVRLDGSERKRLYENISNFCIVDNLLIFEDGQDICKAEVGRGDETKDPTTQSGRGISIVVRGFTRPYADDAHWYADSDWIYFLKSDDNVAELRQALAGCESQVACSLILNRDEHGDVKRMYVQDGNLYFVAETMLAAGDRLSLYRVDIENGGEPVMVGSVEEDYHGEYTDIYYVGDKIYFVDDEGGVRTEVCA